MALLPFVVLWATPAFATEVVTGTHGAVAADHRLASEAGIEILRSGGNAVDAAVAASLVIGVVNPSSAGLGGGGFMVVYSSVDGRAHAIDYRERAPAAATPDMYHVDGVAPQASRRGGLAVAVPGEPAGLEFVLSRFGTLEMATVAAPAIRLAEQGFEVEAHLAERIEAFRQQLAQDPSLAAGFLHADGSPYRRGETLRRPDLAETLRILAERGAVEFYQGEIAADLVAVVKRRGGLLSRQDLANYRVLERKPLIASYRGLSVVGMPPPSSGGAAIAATLNVLAGYRLADLGSNSTTYLHLLIETFKAVFADRAAWYGDPDFVEVPLERLVSMKHALEIRQGLSAVGPAPPDRYGRTTTSDDAGTTHLSVLDVNGNAAACTTSINTAFGSMVAVPERGLILNNTMDDFSARPGVPNIYGLVGSEANSIAAGKRPLSSMSPTIVVRDGAAVLAVGASGGPLIITSTLQTLVNVLDFSMNIGDAVSTPRIHQQWLPDVVGVEGTMPTKVVQGVRRRGHTVTTIKHAGAVQAVLRTAVGENYLLTAVSDPRKGGTASAW